MFKSAHPPTQVPPTRKDSDALSSRRLSKKPTDHHIRGHRLVIENFIDYCIITAVTASGGKARGLRLKRIDVWALCVSENKKGTLYS